MLGQGLPRGWWVMVTNGIKWNWRKQVCVPRINAKEMTGVDLSNSISNNIQRQRFAGKQNDFLPSNPHMFCV